PSETPFQKFALWLCAVAFTDRRFFRETASAPAWRRCTGRISTRSGKAHQEFQPDRHALGWRRSHPEEFRADAAPGRELAADSDLRRAGETNTLRRVRRREARCTEEPSGGRSPVVL